MLKKGTVLALLRYKTVVPSGAERLLFGALTHKVTRGRHSLA